MSATRFDALDGLRGLAAISVLIYHAAQHNGLHWMAGAWKSVDLFFILSGFVIAHSYQHRIQHGMSFRDFAIARFIRLAPLYYVGMALGAIGIALSVGIRGTASTSDVLTALGMGLVWVPDINTIEWMAGAGTVSGAAYPLNGPSWSLFFELWVNLLFFVVVVLAIRLVGTWFAVTLTLGYLTCVLHINFGNPGWGGDTFWFGLPRVASGFFIGAAIYRLGIQRRKLHPLFAFASLLLVFAAFYTGKHIVASVFVIMPVAVAAVSAMRIEGLLQTASRWLGDLSYPLYVLHYPLINFAYLSADFNSLSAPVQVMAIVATSIPIAMGAAVVDKRIREALTQRFMHRTEIVRPRG